MQCVVALSVSLVGFFVLRHYFSPKEKSEDIETNVGALVKHKGIVIQTIEPNKLGRIKVKGEEWPAVVEDGTVLQKGTVVKILRVEGNRLIVMGLS